MKKGQITVFLSLICILLLSFIGGLIASASIQVSKNEKRANMNSALESVFAEYQRDLLNTYDIFALEATYETGEFADENIFKRLQYYGAGEASYEMGAVQLLTDDNGKAFREQVAAYMGEQLKPEQESGLLDNSQEWQKQEEKSEEYQQEEQNVNQQIETDLSGADEELPQEGNPINNISNIKQSGLLNIVVSHPEKLSNKQINIDDMPSNRKLKKGRGGLAAGGTDGALSAVLFREYLLNRFSCYTRPAEDEALSYELEYILSGKDSDKENLETVIKKLTMLRFVPNYAYLLSDSTKQAEAEALALSLCTLLTVPAITGLVKQAILLAWAYGESIMDIRSLLAGHKVEMIKTADNWQLSISGLLTIGTAEDNNEGRDMEEGLDYGGYLRVLLYTNSPEDLSMRSLDLIEQHLRIVNKLSFFRVDSCINKISIHSTYYLQGNITYSFKSKYYYQ